MCFVFVWAEKHETDVFIMFHDSCSLWVHHSAEDVGVKWCQQTSERKEGVQHADSCYQWLDRAVMQARHQSSLGGILNTRRTHTDREREREAHSHMTNRNRKTWTHSELPTFLSAGLTVHWLREPSVILKRIKHQWINTHTHTVVVEVTGSPY